MSTGTSKATNPYKRAHVWRSRTCAICNQKFKTIHEFREHLSGCKARKLKEMYETCTPCDAMPAADWIDFVHAKHYIEKTATPIPKRPLDLSFDFERELRKATLDHEPTRVKERILLNRVRWSRIQGFKKPRIRLTLDRLYDRSDGLLRWYFDASTYKMSTPDVRLLLRFFDSIGDGMSKTQTIRWYRWMRNFACIASTITLVDAIISSIRDGTLAGYMFFVQNGAGNNMLDDMLLSRKGEGTITTCEYHA